MPGQSLIVDLSGTEAGLKKAVDAGVSDLGRLGQAAKVSSELARAGALAQAEAEKTLQAAIERVNAGTASTTEMSKVATAARKAEAAETRAAAEAHKLVHQATEKSREQFGELKSTVISGMGPMGQFGQMLAAGGIVGVGLLGATELVKGFGEALREGQTELHEMSMATAKMEAVFRGNEDAVRRMMVVVGELDKAQPFFEDDQIAQGIAQLKLFDATEGQIKQLIPVLADMAAVMGTDLGSAVDKVGRAMNGQTRGLKEWGIFVKEGATQQEVLNAVLEKAGMFHESAAKLAGEYAGKQAELAKETKNVEAALAEKMQPALLSMMDLKLGVMQTLNDWIQGFNDLRDAASRAAAGMPGGQGSLPSAPVYGTVISRPGSKITVSPSSPGDDVSEPQAWRIPMVHTAGSLVDTRFEQERQRLAQGARPKRKQRASADNPIYTRSNFDYGPEIPGWMNVTSTTNQYAEPLGPPVTKEMKAHQQAVDKFQDWVAERQRKVTAERLQGEGAADKRMMDLRDQLDEQNFSRRVEREKKIGEMVIGFATQAAKTAGSAIAGQIRGGESQGGMISSMSPLLGQIAGGVSINRSGVHYSEKGGEIGSAVFGAAGGIMGALVDRVLSAAETARQAKASEAERLQQIQEEAAAKQQKAAEEQIAAAKRQVEAYAQLRASLSSQIVDFNVSGAVAKVRQGMRNGSIDKMTGETVIAQMQQGASFDRTLSGLSDEFAKEMGSTTEASRAAFRKQAGQAAGDIMNGMSLADVAMKEGFGSGIDQQKLAAGESVDQVIGETNSTALTYLRAIAAAVSANKNITDDMLDQIKQQASQGTERNPLIVAPPRSANRFDRAPMDFWLGARGPRAGRISTGAGLPGLA